MMTMRMITTTMMMMMKCLFYCCDYESGSFSLTTVVLDVILPSLLLSSGLMTSNREHTTNLNPKP